MSILKNINNDLYNAKYNGGKQKDINEQWNKIKNNYKLLSEAVSLAENKEGKKDKVKALTICDFILTNYDDVSKLAYQDLINLIYSNEQIARTVVHGNNNGGISLLLMTLWNPNLRLTEEQKTFAVKEANNKIGTTKYYEQRELRSQELDKNGITDDNIMAIDIDGKTQLMGAKSAQLYYDDLFYLLSDTQAHGFGEFDIRYYILKNYNWSFEEKKKLVFDFYANDEVWNKILEQFEVEIINDPVNYSEDDSCWMEKNELYNYTYDNLMQQYFDIDTAERIWNEIEFCRQMHTIRPQYCENKKDSKSL